MVFTEFNPEDGKSEPNRGSASSLRKRMSDALRVFLDGEGVRKKIEKKKAGSP